MLTGVVFSSCLVDISIHFTTHLIKEIKLLDLVFLHQMYAYERFNSILKSFVRNRAHPEGSMVKGYCTVEAVEWALNYADPSNLIGVHKSRHEGRLTGKGIIGRSPLCPSTWMITWRCLHIIIHETTLNQLFADNFMIFIQIHHVIVA
jgi:hypothetical protein